MLSKYWFTWFKAKLVYEIASYSCYMWIFRKENLSDDGLEMSSCNKKSLWDLRGLFSEAEGGSLHSAPALEVWSP